MNSKLQVMDENNEMVEIQVIDFFQLEEYDHEYVLYTKGEKEGNDVITYVSIINEISDDEIQLEAITDKEEEKKVDEKIDQELELLSGE